MLDNRVRAYYCARPAMGLFIRTRFPSPEPPTPLDRIPELQGPVRYVLDLGQLHKRSDESYSPQTVCSIPDDVIYSIVGQSDVLTLLCWRRTSRSIFKQVAVLLRRRYEECVEAFVPDVQRLDRMMRDAGAIISGSTALRFFLDEERWIPGDLDIYVPDDRYEQFVMQTITDAATSFRYVPRHPLWPIEATDDEDMDAEHDMETDEDENGTPSAGHSLQGIKEVRRFRTTTGRMVDLVRSPVGTPLTPLHSFWSTLVCNFIAPDGCGCAFPAGTMLRKGIVRGTYLSVKDLAGRASTLTVASHSFATTGCRWQATRLPGNLTALGM